MDIPGYSIYDAISMGKHNPTCIVLSRISKILFYGYKNIFKNST